MKNHATQLEFKLGQVTEEGKWHIGFPYATFSMCGRTPNWSVVERQPIVLGDEDPWLDFCFQCEFITWQMDMRFGDH